MEHRKGKLKKAVMGATKKVMGARLADVNLDKMELVMSRMEPRVGAGSLNN